MKGSPYLQRGPYIYRKYGDPGSLKQGVPISPWHRYNHSWASEASALSIHDHNVNSFARVVRVSRFPVFPVYSGSPYPGLATPHNYSPCCHWMRRAVAIFIFGTFCRLSTRTRVRIDKLVYLWSTLVAAVLDCFDRLESKEGMRIMEVQTINWKTPFFMLYTVFTIASRWYFCVTSFLLSQGHMPMFIRIFFHCIFEWEGLY